MKLVRGLAVTLAMVMLPVVLGILGAHAAIRLGWRDVANGSLGFALGWGDAVAPHPWMLLFWGLFGLALGQLTAQRSATRTVTLAMLVVPIVAAASFVIARALGHQAHGGI